MTASMRICASLKWYVTRQHHVAVVRVMKDMIRAMDQGEVTALVLLDLSAAFDTVGHCTQLDVLHRRFAVEYHCYGSTHILQTDRNLFPSTAFSQS